MPVLLESAGIIPGELRGVVLRSEPIRVAGCGSSGENRAKGVELQASDFVDVFAGTGLVIG
jgi:hypothetical protein